MSVVSDTEKLIETFVEIERYIDKLIADTVAKNPTARSLLFWRRRAQLIHARLTTLRTLILRKTPDVISESYKTGVAIALPEGTPAAELEKFQQFGSGINQRAIALLSAGMNDKLDAALVTVGRRVDDAFRQAGLRASAYHAASGTDARMAARHMAQELRRDGVKAFVDRSGRQWNLQTYTRMVIRTTTREAVSQGTFNGLHQTEHELVQVSHHVKSCKICLPFDGQTYAMPSASAEIKARYEVIPQLPPFHPNCKHIIGPASAEFDELEARLLAKYGAHV